MPVEWGQEYPGQPAMVYDYATGKFVEVPFHSTDDVMGAWEREQYYREHLPIYPHMDWGYSMREWEELMAGGGAIGALYGSGFTAEQLRNKSLEDTEAFVEDLFSRMQSPNQINQVRDVLASIGFTRDALDQFFGTGVYETGITPFTPAVQPEITAPSGEEYLQSLLAEAKYSPEAREYLYNLPERGALPLYEAPPGSVLGPTLEDKLRDVPIWQQALKAAFPFGFLIGKESRDALMSLISAGGVWLEKYVGRPWEVAVMEARGTTLPSGQNLVGTTPSEFDIQATNRIRDAFNQYGWTAIFSNEVAEAWDIRKQFIETPQGRFAAEALEWLNPLYMIPIGSSFGFAARVTSKIPLLSKVTRLAATGVQAAEKGLIEATLLPTAARLTSKAANEIGVRLGESLANRLVKQADNLIIDIPTNEVIEKGLLVNNWMKRTLTFVSKIPPLKAGFEKGLGWRILVKRESQAVEDILGRAATVYGHILRMGENGKAPITWRLRSIEMNPVRYFGFNRQAYSTKMADRLLPEFIAEKDIAGTLEHVFTQPTKYNWEGLDRGLEYVTEVNNINGRILELLKAEGAAPEHVLEDWIHRVVTGKTTPAGEVAIRGKPGVGGRAIGARASFEKARKFKTMAEGIQYGIQYEPNIEASVGTYIEEAFKKIGDKRMESYMEAFGIKPSERLAERFPELVERAALTQTELADAAKFQSIINRAIRGEKLPVGTLKAMEKRFPELGKKLRSLITDEPMKPIDEATYLAEHGPKELFDYPIGEPSLEYQKWLDIDAIKVKIEQLENRKFQAITKPVRETIDIELSKLEAQRSVSAFKTIGELDVAIEGIERELGNRSMPYHGGAKNWYPDYSTKQLDAMLNVYREAKALGIVSMPKLKIFPKTQQVELKTLLNEVKTIVESRKIPYWQTRAEKAAKLEQVRLPQIGEGYIMQPFAGGKIYTQEFIDSFNKFFGYEKGIGALKVTSDVAGILRITKAALDLSAMAIQGLPSWGLAHATLLTNPVAGAKMIGGWYKAWFLSNRAFLQPSVLASYMAKTESSVLKRISFGGSSKSIDYFSVLQARGGLGGVAEKVMKKIPLSPYERAETAFFGAGEIVRDEFWKILSPKVMKQGKGFELARMLDRLTGLTEARSLGVPLTVRQLEQTFMWFAPNYTRACLTVLSDIFRGGVTGGMARKAIGGMVAAGSAYYTAVQYGISTLSGKNEEEAWNDVQVGLGVREDPITHEITWKPSAQFMTVKVGNYYFGFGGFWYGLLRLAGNIAECVTSQGEREPIDLIRIMKYGSFNKRDNPFIYWWYSRSSPLVGTGFELVSGKDFLGYPIETPEEYAKYILSRFEPIWMEQGLNWLIPGWAKDNEIPEGAARAALAPAELFGMRSFPESTWVKFYDKSKEYIKQIPKEELDPKQIEAWQNGTLGWAQLTEMQKINLLSRYEDLNALYERAQADSAVRNSPQWQAWDTRTQEEKAIYYQRLDELTQRLQNGEINTQEYREFASEAGENYGAALGAIERDPNYSLIYDYFKKAQAEGDKYGFSDDIALSEYQSTILYADDITKPNGDYDWTERDKRVSAFIDKWGMDVYERVQAYLQDKKRYAGLSEVWIRKGADTEQLGREYWQLPFKPIYEMTIEELTEGGLFGNYGGQWADYNLLTNDKAREQYLIDHPEFAKDWRNEYRLNNPEADARLALWGYSGKLQTRAAYDLVVKWGKELGIPLDKMGLGLPPENLIDYYFELNKLIADTSASSAEVKLYKLNHPEYLEWGVDTYGWDDLSGEDVRVLNITVTYREQSDWYENGIPNLYKDVANEYDRAAKIQEARDVFMAQNDDYRKAMRLKEAYGLTGAGPDYPKFSESQSQLYVDYYEQPDYGYFRDRFLAEHDSTVGSFADMMHKVVGMDLPDFDAIPNIEYDNITRQYKDFFDKLNGLANYKSPYYVEDNITIDPDTGRTPREQARYALLYNADGTLTAFGIATLTRKAYELLTPKALREKGIDPSNEKILTGFVNDYVKFYTYPAAGYDRDIFLKENRDFYDVVYQGLMGNEKIDFGKVPSREVAALWSTYDSYSDKTSSAYIKNDKLRDQARLAMRCHSADLDEWMVSVKGYTAAYGTDRCAFVSGEAPESGGRTWLDLLEDQDVFEDWLKRFLA